MYTRPNTYCPASASFPLESLYIISYGSVDLGWSPADVWYRNQVSNASLNDLVGVRAGMHVRVVSLTMQRGHLI